MKKLAEVHRAARHGRPEPLLARCVLNIKMMMLLMKNDDSSLENGDSSLENDDSSAHWEDNNSCV